MEEIEREKVFLVKALPDDIKNHKAINIKIGDFFDPDRINSLKLRQKGDQFELIKKEAKSIHERTEHRIEIVKGEFEALWKATERKHEKIRVFYPLGELTCEVDFYRGKLDGYVRAEVEFNSEEEMNNFVAPDWFAEEITALNHEIHEGLGNISFDDMKARFLKEKINLLKINE